MKTIGIRTLKAQTSEILRQVREEGATYAVTYRGKTVAHIEPVSPSDEDEDQMREEWWKAMDALAAEISAAVKDDMSAVDAVREMRREL